MVSEDVPESHKTTGKIDRAIESALVTNQFSHALQRLIDYEIAREHTDEQFLNPLFDLVLIRNRQAVGIKLAAIDLHARLTAIFANLDDKGKWREIRNANI